MRISKKLVTTITAAGLSVGLCTVTANTAMAVVEGYRYAVSSGSITGGYYSGSYNVQVSSSKISIGSFSARTYCKAVQDGHNRGLNSSIAGDVCSMSDYGEGTLANQDYVYYRVG